MRSAITAVLLLVGLHAAPAPAASPDASPLAGRWTLDIAKLTMPPEARPKRVDLEFRAEADGRWTTQVEITDQGGKRMSTHSTLSLDGTPGRASGTYWVDVLAASMPAPNVLVMQIVYQGIPRSTRVFSVADDGSVLTETEAYFKEDGTPMQRIAFFSRLPDAP